MTVLLGSVFSNSALATIPQVDRNKIPYVSLTPADEQVNPIHPYVFGYPFRLRALRTALKHCFSNKLVERVWKCKPEDVSDHCHKLEPGIVPGS